MQNRRLGNSDLYITPIGFGAWAIGGSGWEFAWGRQNDQNSIAAIHRALDLSATLDAKGFATCGSDRVRDGRRPAAGECDERDLQLSHAPG